MAAPIRRIVNGRGHVAGLRSPDACPRGGQQVTDTLRLLSIDTDAAPLFSRMRNGVREGYEPAAAELVAEVLGREVVWVFRPWSEFLPSLNSGDADAIWCGQAVTEERRKVVSFTRPYAVFDEGVLVRANSGITSKEDLQGRAVGAIAESTNMALAETFGDVVTVPFDGTSDDVFGEMIQALRDGKIDALVDDDVVLAPLADDEEFEVAFTERTRNEWAVAVSQQRPELLIELDAALAEVIADGRLADAWRRWMPPSLKSPFS
jgi:polar amino acid transport system substrate-binding protein